MKNLNEIMWDKCQGQYDYKLGNTFYQIYKYNRSWIVYETEEFGYNLDNQVTPYDWQVLEFCETLKEAKEVLIQHLNSIN